ncbi:cysteine--tRNA ligase [Candidatus Daviesbacteria bacterium]|nr:cysteine--tRNA ligase [Candidatus Daviesbacteria bacterium]
MKLYNTLTRKIENFTPIKPSYVGMYTCGPTVYDYTHIGHLRKYVGDDILRRILEANGYSVKHVMNITDVGHLVSDQDQGDDKLEKGAKERGQTVWEVAKYFEDYFFRSTKLVNIERPSVVCRATEHIGEQIKLIQKLEEKGFTYQTEEAIYFDISKFPHYGKLSGQDLKEKQTGVRGDVVVDPNKKNPQDFALWFFVVGRFVTHSMRWASPWGEGFPGWHIECSAMSMEYLGNSFDPFDKLRINGEQTRTERSRSSRTIDIHTGGIDHIPVHHTNEIAQSEAASGKMFVRVWVHHNFLIVDGEKMSKSKKNFYRIDEILSKGFDPLALRYLFLTAHYRDSLNFTWKSLESTQNALNNLREEIRLWEQPKGSVGQYWQKFAEAANNDLNTPQAVAIMWEMVKSDIPTFQKSKDLAKMDEILGLGLQDFIGQKIEVPKEVMELVNIRETVRKKGDYKESDKLRHQIKKLGFEVEDTPSGPKVKQSV